MRAVTPLTICMHAYLVKNTLYMKCSTKETEEGAAEEDVPKPAGNLQ
jgi:hypothetical protein